MLDENRKNLPDEEPDFVDEKLASFYQREAPVGYSPEIIPDPEPEKTYHFPDGDEEVKRYTGAEADARAYSDDGVASYGESGAEEGGEDNGDEPFIPEIDPERITKRRTSNKKLREINRRKNRIRQTKRTSLHIFGGVLLTVFIVSVSVQLAAFIVRFALDFTGITTTEFDVEIEITEYDTTESIAEKLHRNGIITMPDIFVTYSRISGSDGQYLTGAFSVNSAMDYSSLVKTLQTIEQVDKTVTVRIREGMTAAEIGKLLEENLVCRAVDFEYYYKTKQDKYNFEKRVEDNSKKFYQMEGYLFPDTYEFYVIESIQDNPNYDTSSAAATAAKTIYRNFNEKITKVMYKRMSEIGLTLNEVITLASMVQKEAAVEEDMLKVASVFLNRLHDAETYPYLQSDVTGLYVENTIRPNVTEQNQALYAPIMRAYSTYETAGIPPGPICNPGLDAIEAVLYAPETDLLYFCANEETMEMYFAVTLEQHELNLVEAGLAV